MSSRKKLIAGNWKMFMNTQQAREFALNFQERVAEVTDKDIVICATIYCFECSEGRIGRKHYPYWCTGCVLSE